jgi:hypothetical protein
VRDGYGVTAVAAGYPVGMSDDHREPLQNDPDRAAGSLVPDAVGEFVADEPGGAFDPRTFRGDRPERDAPEPEPDREPARPPMDDERMSGPGEEIDKAR